MAQVILEEKEEMSLLEETGNTLRLALHGTNKLVSTFSHLFGGTSNMTEVGEKMTEKWGDELLSEHEFNAKKRKLKRDRKIAKLQAKLDAEPTND